MTELKLSPLRTLPAAEFDPSSTKPFQLPQPCDLSLECTATTPSSTWRRFPASGCLPWLWDLKLGTIAQKEASKPLGRNWNWELLVRQLAQVNLHEPKAVLEDIPNGLRNRRRIWRLVQDILSEEQSVIQQEFGSEADSKKMTQCKTTLKKASNRDGNSSWLDPRSAIC